jgi:hypothetical protein
MVRAGIINTIVTPERTTFKPFPGIKFPFTNAKHLVNSAFFYISDFSVFGDCQFNVIYSQSISPILIWTAFGFYKICHNKNAHRKINSNQNKGCYPMLRSTIAALSITFFSTGVFAHPISITPTDSTMSTLTCYTAAKDGLEHADKLLKKHGSSLAEFRKSYRCNDEDIVTFVKRIERKVNQRDSKAWYSRELDL